MSKAEEICNRCPQQSNCDYIKIKRRNKCTYYSYFEEGYEYAETEILQELKRLSFSSNAMDYIEWVSSKIKELEA